jgi:membrane fusion protein, multidrug efflux system
MMTRTIWSTLALSALLVGCRPESEAAAPQVRPVRTVTIEKREAGSPVTLTGRIEAKDEVALGFRISGRLLENKANLGDRVKPGDVIARLEPQNELNQLRSAEANFAAAQAQLTQAQNHFERQDTLLQQGWTTRAIWDQAKKALQTARAQVDSAEAQLKAAHDLVSFTQLEADAPGVVTEVGPRAGTYSLDACHRLLGDAADRHRYAAHIAWRADYRSGAARGRRHDHRRCHAHPARAG